MLTSYFLSKQALIRYIDRQISFISMADLDISVNKSLYIFNLIFLKLILSMLRTEIYTEYYFSVTPFSLVSEDSSISIRDNMEEILLVSIKDKKAHIRNNLDSEIATQFKLPLVSDEEFNFSEILKVVLTISDTLKGINL